MRKLLTRMVLLIAMVSMAGCVAQGKYDQMRTAWLESQSRNTELQAQLEEARSRLRALEAEEDRTPEMQQEIDRLREALAQAEEQLRQAQARPGPIPERVNEQLIRLAEENDMMSYDEDRGMVKFESDFTFDLGSAQVSDEARDVLGQLAQILNSNAATPFGVRIVGHTDAVPIQRAETRQNHPTNWHLSVHRAISIKDVLEDANVEPDRMGVAGYGPYQPIVENDSSGAARENRRVELYLVDRGSASRSGRSSQGQAGSQSQSEASGQSSSSQEENPAMFK